MHKLYLRLGVFLFVIFGGVLFSQNVYATSSNIVIYQIQSGATSTAGDASSEFVSLYNNSTSRVDITNWQVVSNSNTLVSFTPSSPSMKLYFEPRSFTTLASTTFKTPGGLSYTPSVLPNFSGSKIVGSSTSGVNLRVIDANSTDVDSVNWTTDGASNIQILQRKNTTTAPLLLLDTDTYSDFDKVSQTAFQIPAATPLTEEVVVVDQCPNLPGLDSSLPVGYMKDTDGNCYEDVCDNISGLQKVLPNGYYKDGIDCKIVGLKLTELLPNVSGSDTGKEFIEIYNPTNYQVDLSGYLLQLGPSYSKNFILPSFILMPNSFVSFSDIETTITLPNTSASVKLLTPSSDFVDETASYNEPKDDQAWALFADSWQYTNQPTAANANMVSVVAGLGAGDDGELAVCPEGKYRNPETNRCKTIETDAGLKPCAVDQIRNPETNRCRSIFASDSGLTPCKADQTRNPETNRCRSTENSSNTLKPCAANQERNPETNRCRKMTAGTIAANKVKDVESNLQAERGGWFLAGSAGIGLAGYGVAEWRTEISSALRRFRQLLGKNPPDL